MKEYRAYLIGSDGHFTSREGFVAVDDDAAIGTAQRFARLCDVEVWQAARKVGLIKSLEGGEHDHGGTDQQDSKANPN
jgi:hypothetical protein